MTPNTTCAISITPSAGSRPTPNSCAPPTSRHPSRPSSRGGPCTPRGRAKPLHDRTPYTLVVGLKYLMAAVLCAGPCLAQNYEIGGAIGYGLYRDGTIYSPG